jgi:hypothetical protein
VSGIFSYPCKYFDSLQIACFVERDIYTKVSKCSTFMLTFPLVKLACHAVVQSFCQTLLFLDVILSFVKDPSQSFSLFQVAIACYPLQCYPARSILEDAIKHVFHRPGNEASRNRHIFVTLLIFISTLVTALLITNLGTVSYVHHCLF